MEKAIDTFIEDLIRRRNAHTKADLSKGLHSLFQGLSEANLQTFLSSSHIVETEEGQEITAQGDDATYLFYILKGSVKTQRFNSDGKEATIRMLGAGETFMEDAIFIGSKSPVYAITTRDSRLLMIPAETVRRRALSDPQLACNLMKILSRHYKNAIQQIDSIVTKSPVERLGYYFLKLHMEQGSDSMDIALPFQKSTIANHLGITPETFSRALSQIKKIGIDVDHEKLTLRDAYALCHFCDADMATDCHRFNTPDCHLCPDKKHKNCH